MKIDKSRLFKRFSESFELDIDVNDLEDDKSVERSFGRFTNKSYDKQPVPVRCKVMFSRMGTIDTILERFDCQAYIECSWEDDELFYQILNLDNPIELDNLKKDLLRSQNSKEYLYNYAIKNLKDFKYNPETHWSPKIYIENTISGSQQEIKYKIEIADKFERRNSALTVVSSWLDESKQLIDLENFNDIIENNYTVRVIEMRFVNGIFYEKLELYDFPVDQQELSIVLTSERSSTDVQLFENNNDPSSISTSVFLNQQEWSLFDFVKTTKRTAYDTCLHLYRPCLVVSSYVVRKPGYYINNAYFLVFLITALGFVPFSVDLKQPNARCLVTGVLLLTQVNFRWIITQRIPSVSYLTSIDKFAIGNLFFLILFAVWHAIIGTTILSDDSTIRKKIDNYILCFFGIAFIIHTLIYILMIIILCRKAAKAKIK